MRLVLCKAVFWHIDQHPKTGDGWPSAIYFDREANVYRVLDVTTKRLTLTYDELPPFNTEFTFETEEPIQYAKGCLETTHFAEILESYPFPIRARS